MEENEKVKKEADEKENNWTWAYPFLLIACILFTVWFMTTGDKYQKNRISELERENEILRYQNKYNVSYYYNKCTPVLQKYLYDTYTNDVDSYIMFLNMGVGDQRDTLVEIKYNTANSKYYGVFQVNGQPDYHYTFNPHLFEE